MSEENTKKENADDLLQMTSNIISAYVSCNTLPASELGDTIKTVYDTLQNLQTAENGAGLNNQKPAVPIKKSITDDYIICLEDGTKLKMLKRYLRTNFNMTPEEYREKWGLPSDYPMVAPNYAAQRSDFAKKIGLGRNRRDSA